MTPFGRQAVTAGLLASHVQGPAPCEGSRFAKWELFRALCAGRAAFGVRDRDLTVLNALLTFYRPEHLEAGAAMIVYPSNKVLAERAHGMAESTLRRHLAALVKAGLVLRHDSPNGKRFARKDRTGEVVVAFGFDLSPLLARATEIVDAAQAAETQQETLRCLRERCVLLVRDAGKLVAYGQESGAAGTWDAWDDAVRLAQRALRRKPETAPLQALLAEMSAVLSAVEAALVRGDQEPDSSVDRVEENVPETEEMSGNDVKTERHQQNSNTHTLEFELSPEKGRAAATVPLLPLPLVLKACPEVQAYSRTPIADWADLVTTAEFVRGMLGVSQSAWTQAVDAMGACQAAIVLACILERVEHIRSPGGYLRALTEKAGQGAFSPGPMVMALLNGDKRAA